MKRNPLNMELKNLTFNLLILFSFIVCISASDTTCVYNIHVQTGDKPLAGTQSNISLFLSDGTKNEVTISNLKDWALSGSASDHFGPGKLDAFAGTGPCLSGTPCSLIIVLDGDDDWYCDFIEVTTVGVGNSCDHKGFTVKKWLGNSRGAKLILQDECDSLSHKIE